jgi:hypothetical protein
MLAGALLHLAWRLALAALVWTPSAYVGIVTGWHVGLWTEHAGLGVVAAVGVAALIRAIVDHLLFWLSPRRALLIAWTEF